MYYTEHVYHHLTTDLQIHKANADRTERRHRKIHNKSCRFNIPLSVVDKTSRQKIVIDTEDVNNSIN